MNCNAKAIFRGISSKGMNIKLISVPTYTTPYYFFFCGLVWKKAIIAIARVFKICQKEVKD
jgi:hypothetical protein